MQPKLMKTALLIVFLLAIQPVSSYGFHRISETLPSNKILICKDYDQVKTDQKIEVYTKRFSNSRSGRELVKTDEFMLPKEGQVISLHHNEFHSTGKFFPKTHTELLGTATVVSPKLVGESRVVNLIPKGKRETIETKTQIITEQDEANIVKNCFVAVPDKTIKIKDVTSVSF
ncbi:hypothetical protein C0V70_05895 [Bacteriovorax stolpii]|uniref:Uncharacterized protein n=2 Tax=Bacteriovorax stolpii TaxID=960 RepID=A0A2K9NQ69_BACTC|nr:hypothetical protein C0V70_05895 [Bacteriovorax stolpii]TDP52835.1 hypothetical protein C8D79_2602 [Bacteriovorax stolpii]